MALQSPKTPLGNISKELFYLNTFVNLNTVSGSASLKSILLLLLVVLIHFPNCGHSAKLHSSQKQHRQRFVPSIGSIELLNNKLHGLSPAGGLVSPPGGFALFSFDQGVS